MQKGIIMAFKLIDIENWERREFYEHFSSQVVCSYSVSVNLDFTNLSNASDLIYFGYFGV